MTYIDTGAMYRAVAWKAQQAGVDPGDAAALGELAARLRIDFRRDAANPASPARLFVDGEDASEPIRQPEISGLASVVSAVPGVRSALVREQRRMGAAG